MIAGILRGNKAKPARRWINAALRSADLGFNALTVRRTERALTTGAKRERYENQCYRQRTAECIVMARRSAVPNYSDLLKEFPLRSQRLPISDLKCTQPDYCFVKELDGEYRETNIHVEICQAVETLKPDLRTSEDSAGSRLWKPPAP